MGRFLMRGMDEKRLAEGFPQIELPESQETIKSKNRTATVLYNGMFHPLAGIACVV
mgnify:CR=1 FL=1